jgi:hypothetical protein
MHDAAVVHVVHRASDLHREDRRDVVGQAAALLQEIVEIDPLHVLHHDEHRAAFLVEVVDVDDVFVLQVRERFGFALEPRDDVFFSSCAGFQRFDRNRSPERLLDGAVNHRHSTRSDLLHDAAVADPFEHVATRRVPKSSTKILATTTT